MAETAVSGPIQNEINYTNAEIASSERGLSFAIKLTAAMTFASIVFFALGVAGVGSSAVCVTAGSVFLSVPVIMLIRSFITRS